MPNAKAKNTFATIILTVCLGAVVGLVLWLFLRAVAIGSGFIWNFLPSAFGIRWLMIPVCAAGGLIAGIIRKKYGDYPEELDVVMGKVKKEKHYSYKHMLPMLICALIPLIFGSSVGPEAGLTGIIAGLCYWIGDNVSYARKNASLYSEIGEAVTLGQIFHMPLFGILAVEEDTTENGSASSIPKVQKLLLYALAAVTVFAVFAALNRIFHTSMEGFPRFSEARPLGLDYAFLHYALSVVYIIIGVLLCLIFNGAEKLAETAAAKIPAVLRETLCGAVIGAMGLIAPIVLFSGEEQMAELMESFGGYAPWLLVGAGVLKVLMTAFCLRFGLKGGHFFPLIFACVCVGFGTAGLFFSAPAEHAVFAACIVTSATLGAQLKKPLAVSFLMLLCFPLRLMPWIFVAAAVGAWLSKLLEKKKHIPNEENPEEKQS